MNTIINPTDPFRMTKLVISFNRHFFGIALRAIVLGIVVAVAIPLPALQVAAILGVCLATYFIIASIVASHFVYDRSDLYKLQRWPDRCLAKAPEHALLVHAGFDPASHLVRQKYPHMRLRVFDFFDPSETTEASIKLAHALNPAGGKQDRISSDLWPVPDASQDAIFLLSAAHEIRDPDRRTAFFQEARRVLAPQGQIIVIEQLRDLPNFLAFGVAAFHFLSRRTWLRSFADGGLRVEREFIMTSWMRIFVLGRPDSLTPHPQD